MYICVYYNPSVVSYGLILHVRDNEDGCGGVNGINEGIEFAIRNNTNGGPWIPLQLDYRNNTPDTDERREIRGYNVSAIRHAKTNKAVIDRNVSICGDILDTNTIQLRWMQSSIVSNKTPHFDVWALAYVNATFIEANETIHLINEIFGCGSTGECALK